jgi:acyl-CoA reductase-like NAD-dependent aldehyde dehydrogenase
LPESWEKAASERVFSERAAASSSNRIDARAIDPLDLPELGSFEPHGSDARPGAKATDAAQAAAARRQAPSAPSAPSATAPVSAEAIAEALDDARESIAEAVQHSVLAELRQMKAFISDQLETLSWFEGTALAVRNRLLRTLMTAGFRRWGVRAGRVPRI